MPYFASPATLQAALQLLDYTKPVYLSMSHRFWEITSFKVDIPLFLPLLIFTLSTLIGYYPIGLARLKVKK